MDHLYEIKIKEIWAFMKTQDSLFWLINLYLFLEYVRPLTIYPAIDVIPFTRIILILTLLIFLLRGNVTLVKNPLNSLLILYFLVILLSSMLALSPSTAFGNITDFMAWMIIYFLIINIVNSENRFFIFMFSFFLYSFKMSQFSLRNWVADGFRFMKIGSGGGVGWFNNSGEFGIQMVIFFSLSLYFFWALKDYWPLSKKVGVLLFPSSALISTVSSSSRGALLGLGGVLLVVILKSKHKFKGLLFICFASLTVLIFLPDQQIARFQTAGVDATSMNRIHLWRAGLDLIDRYPVLGVGYRNWLVALEKYHPDTIQQVCHNIFIECASELGCSGLIVFLLMIIFTFINNAQTRKLTSQGPTKNKFLFYMAHGLDGALVGYLVSGFFVTVLYYPFFWINLAMTVSLREAARKWSISLTTDTPTSVNRKISHIKRLG